MTGWSGEGRDTARCQGGDGVKEVSQSHRSGGDGSEGVTDLHQGEGGACVRSTGSGVDHGKVRKWGGDEGLPASPWVLSDGKTVPSVPVG